MNCKRKVGRPIVRKTTAGYFLKIKHRKLILQVAQKQMRIFKWKNRKKKSNKLILFMQIQEKQPQKVATAHQTMSVMIWNWVMVWLCVFLDIQLVFFMHYVQ